MSHRQKLLDPKYWNGEIFYTPVTEFSPDIEIIMFEHAITQNINSTIANELCLLQKWEAKPSALISEESLLSTLIQHIIQQSSGTVKSIRE
jgi:hypothetical protein